MGNTESATKWEVAVSAPLNPNANAEHRVFAVWRLRAGEKDLWRRACPSFPAAVTVAGEELCGKEELLLSWFAAKAEEYSEALASAGLSKSRPLGTIVLPLECLKNSTMGKVWLGWSSGETSWPHALNLARSLKTPKCCLTLPAEVRPTLGCGVTSTPLAQSEQVEPMVRALHREHTELQRQFTAELELGSRKTDEEPKRQMSSDSRATDRVRTLEAQLASKDALLKMLQSSPAGEELRARAAEDNTRAAEERARVAEDSQRAAEARAAAAEESARAAQDRLRSAEATATVSQDSEKRLSIALDTQRAELEATAAIAKNLALAELEEKVRSVTAELREETARRSAAEQRALEAEQRAQTLEAQARFKEAKPQRSVSSLLVSEPTTARTSENGYTSGSDCGASPQLSGVLSRPASLAQLKTPTTVPRQIAPIQGSQVQSLQSTPAQGTRSTSSLHANASPVPGTRAGFPQLLAGARPAASPSYTHQLAFSPYPALAPRR